MGMEPINLVCARCGKRWVWRAFNATHKPKRCPPCKKIAALESNRRGGKKHRLKARYGMSLKDYDAMLVEQESRCAICLEESDLVLDHCHRSGSPRGLLCQRCNFLLGYLEAGGFGLVEACERYLVR